jgi:hypothetical protein
MLDSSRSATSMIRRGLPIHGRVATEGCEWPFDTFTTQTKTQSRWARVLFVVFWLGTVLCGLSCFTRRSQDTEVSEQAFHMLLPGEWNRFYDEAASRWNFTTEKEQITVSLMSAKRNLADSERHALLTRLLDLRRQAEREVTEGKLVLSDNTWERKGEVYMARYQGEDPTPPKRLFMCLAVLNRTTVGLFYYEAINLSSEDFATRGRAALDSVVLNESPSPTGHYTAPSNHRMQLPARRAAADADR